MKLNRIIIEAITLPDAWFQLIHTLVNKGRKFKIDKGSYAGQHRIEFDWIDVHILKPWLRTVDNLPLLPEMPESCTIPPPVEKQYLIDYIPYLLTADKKSNEAYTYGSRLCNTWSGELENAGFNQITEIIETYKRNGHRNNQMVLQIAQPNDLSLNDPPCLRHIDTRIQDNKLHFFPYFRSWDLWGGFPANLAAISVLQEYMASEINIEQGEMICTSKGLHIYGYVEELAKIRIGEKE